MDLHTFIYIFLNVLYNIFKGTLKYNYIATKPRNAKDATSSLEQ